MISEIPGAVAGDGLQGGLSVGVYICWAGIYRGFLARRH